MVLQGLLPKSLEKTMYVSFLAGCFRSIRFGLVEAHGYEKTKLMHFRKAVDETL